MEISTIIWVIVVAVGLFLIILSPELTLFLVAIVGLAIALVSYAKTMSRFNKNKRDE